MENKKPNNNKLSAIFEIAEKYKKEYKLHINYIPCRGSIGVALWMSRRKTALRPGHMVLVATFRQKIEVDEVELISLNYSIGNKKLLESLEPYSTAMTRVDEDGKQIIKPQ